MPNPVREMKQIASNDVNSYVKTDLRGILKTAWFVQSVKRGKLTKTTATASYWGCHYQWTYPILTRKTHTRLPFTVACTDRGSQEMWTVTLHPQQQFSWFYRGHYKARQPAHTLFPAKKLVVLSYLFSKRFWEPVELPLS